MSHVDRVKKAGKMQVLSKTCRKASLIYVLYQNYRLIEWFCRELRRR